MRDYLDTKQENCDIRTFEQRFRAVYADAKNLNAAAELNGVQLRAQFVSKVHRELHKALYIQYADYAQTMQLHEITNELTDIEEIIYLQRYETQRNNCNSYAPTSWQGSNRGGYRQQYNRDWSSHSSQICIPCNVCGNRTHNAQECRVTVDKAR